MSSVATAGCRRLFLVVLASLVVCLASARCAHAALAAGTSSYCDLTTGATLYYDDILDKSDDWKQKALNVLTGFSAAMGFEGRVKDIGVVGSLAAGVGRGPNDHDPSDIDFAITVNMTDEVLKSRDFRDKTKAVLPAWQEKMQRELDTTLAINITFIPPEKYTVDDPDYIYFSLSQNKMYGRDNRERRNVKYVWYGGKWQRFDRAAFDRYYAISRKVVTSQKIDVDGRMIYYIEQTGEVIMRSF